MAGQVREHALASIPPDTKRLRIHPPLMFLIGGNKLWLLHKCICRCLNLYLFTTGIMFLDLTSGYSREANVDSFHKTGWWIEALRFQTSLIFPRIMFALNILLTSLPCSGLKLPPQ